MEKTRWPASTFVATLMVIAAVGMWVGFHRHKADRTVLSYVLVHHLTLAFIAWIYSLWEFFRRKENTAAIPASLAFLALALFLGIT